MSEGDRWVDMVQEGVDCVLRYGKLPDSELVARQVAMLDRLTCATPAYLERFGTPTSLASLDGHRMVGIRSVTTGNVTPLEFNVHGEMQAVSIPAVLTVTGTELPRRDQAGVRGWPRCRASTSNGNSPAASWCRSWRTCRRPRHPCRCCISAPGNYRHG